MVRFVLSVVLLLAGAAPAHAADTVVGGHIAADGSFPWMVRLSMGCGGALIAPQVVLTAGHCVAGTGATTDIEVTAGVTDRQSKDALKVRSVEVILAPGFQGEVAGDDWALVKIDRALDLETLDLTAGEAPTEGTYTVLGWGLKGEKAIKQQRRLRYATVPIVPDKTCSDAYEKVKVDLVEDEQFCAGREGVDTCQGDSGGPIVGKDVTGRWVQVGIVSWGLGCGRPGYPGVYLQVTTFRTAILDGVGKLS